MGNNIIREDMKKDKWLDPRIYYLKTITRPLPSKCPECEGPLETNEYGETICTDCQLVCSGPIPYVGLEHIDYPYGLRL